VFAWLVVDELVSIGVVDGLVVDVEDWVVVDVENGLVVDVENELVVNEFSVEAEVVVPCVVVAGVSFVMMILVSLQIRERSSILP